MVNSPENQKKIRIRLQPKSVIWALRLRCTMCGKTPLLEKGKLLTFRKGCPNCNYKYEREPGYFWGQSMMISYPILGLILVLIGYLLKMIHPDFKALHLALVLFGLSIPLIFLTNPHSRAAWMLLDHYFNPINDLDSLDNE